MARNSYAGNRNKTKDSLQKEISGLGFPITVLEEYQKALIKIKFSCQICSHEWSATPNNILRGRGCPACVGKKWSVDDVEKSFELLGKKFTILSFISKQEMEVKCDICGYKWKTNYSNVKNNGCSNCSGKLKGSVVSLQVKLDEMKSNITVSGNYKNKDTHISCRCNLCSYEWATSPAPLMRGTKCPNCAFTGFNPNLPAYLYYLRVTDGENIYWKIGITGKNIKHRFHGEDRKKIIVLYSYYFQNGKQARDCEQNILKMYEDYRVKNLSILKRGGNTEMFFRDVLQMDHLGDSAC